jgi:hypothetical protein
MICVLESAKLKAADSRKKYENSGMNIIIPANATGAKLSQVNRELNAACYYGGWKGTRRGSGGFKPSRARPPLVALGEGCCRVCRHAIGSVGKNL